MAAPNQAWVASEILVNEVRRNPNNPVPRRLPRVLLITNDDTLVRTTAQEAGAVYVSLFENLCDQTSCLMTTSSGWKDLVTYDNAHFTEHGSIVVAQRIWESITHADNSLSRVVN